MSARRIKAKYAGRCDLCGGKIPAGETIAWFPPKGRRKHGETVHEECKARLQRRSNAPRTDWPAREHTRSWMSPEDFAMTEEAMSRQRPVAIADAERSETTAREAVASESKPPARTDDLLATNDRHKQQSPARKREWPDEVERANEGGDS